MDWSRSFSASLNSAEFLARRAVAVSRLCWVLATSLLRLPTSVFSRALFAVPSSLLAVGDRLRLQLVVRLAPTSHTLIDVLVFLGFLVELSYHVLQQRDYFGHWTILALVLGIVQRGDAAAAEEDKQHEDLHGAGSGKRGGPPSGPYLAGVGLEPTGC